MRSLACFLLLWLGSQTLIAQILPDIDTAGNSVIYEYWKPRYYDSIPVKSDLGESPAQPYEEMIVRYQNKDFEYVESISDKLSFFETLIDRINRFLEGLFPRGNYQLNDAFYNILAILGGIVFLFLVYKLFFSGKKVYINLEDEQDTEEQIAFVERNLMQVDLRQYIRDALKKENYALAIRYQQLFNIQLLNEKGYIDWKHTKTNMELMEDVDNPALKKEFLDCTAIYDHIWFGDFVIAQGDYARYEQIFRQFQQRWG
ncbi:MAG TPA: hypothetical protein PKA53_01095 [Sphingobacterium sp.]|nr:hypothetical protein [Sphingobacterium sp.]